MPDDPNKDNNPQQTPAPTQEPQIKIPQTAEELQAQIDATLAAQAQTPEQKEDMIEVKTATGEVYRGKTQQEIIDQLIKGREEATNALRDRERQIREINERNNPPAEPSTPAFDKAKFYSLMAEDPMAGLQYQLSAVMGVPPEQTLDALRYVFTVSQQVDSRLQNAMFRDAYPDAPYGDDFANTMADRMNEKRRPWTADQLSTTYLELVHEGKVKPVQAETPASQEAPPPNPGRVTASNPAPDIVTQLESMSTREMEAYLKKIGVM